MHLVKVGTIVHFKKSYYVSNLNCLQKIRDFSKKSPIQPTFRPPAEKTKTSHMIRLGVAVVMSVSVFSYFIVDQLKAYYHFILGYSKGVVVQGDVQEIVNIHIPFITRRGEKKEEFPDEEEEFFK